MPYVLTEEQTMLKNSAREFLNSKAPVSQLRSLRDSKNEMGYDHSTWHQMVGMGWVALTIPEEYDGLGFGYLGLGQILEETGRTLTASPLLSTVGLGACAFLEAGTEAQKASFLPRISCGELTITLAIEESNRHNPELLSTTLTAQNGGYELNGVKKFVIDAHTCDQIIVICKGADGKQKLIIVDSDRDGVNVEREIMMDSRNYGKIEFNKVRISAEEVLGNASEKSIERILDIGRICLSAELYGTAIEAFERSIAYLKERKQFGVELATFQGLQHRSADMYCQLEMCNSAVLDALSAIDNGEQDLRLKASIVKSKMSQVAHLVTNEAVQFYGGIGMTDEEEIGFFLKRARVAMALLGDHNFHLNRFATLSGY